MRNTRINGMLLQSNLPDAGRYVWNGARTLKPGTYQVVLLADGMRVIGASPAFQVGNPGEVAEVDLVIAEREGSVEGIMGPLTLEATVREALLLEVSTYQVAEAGVGTDIGLETADLRSRVISKARSLVPMVIDAARTAQNGFAYLQSHLAHTANALRRTAEQMVIAGEEMGEEMVGLTVTTIQNMEQDMLKLTLGSFSMVTIPATGERIMSFYGKELFRTGPIPGPEGCGGAATGAVPDGLFGLGFTHSCAIHDEDWRHDPSLFAKLLANEQFFINMVNENSDSLGGRIKVSVVARVYTIFVHINAVRESIFSNGTGG